MQTQTSGLKEQSQPQVVLKTFISRYIRKLTNKKKSLPTDDRGPPFMFWFLNISPRLMLMVAPQAIGNSGTYYGKKLNH